MVGIDQSWEMFEEQCGQQGGDMQVVGVGIGQYYYFVVVQVVDVVFVWVVVDCDGQVVYFFGGQYVVGGDFLGVQDFVVQWYDCLEVFVVCLFGVVIC